jgi:superfamily II DNA/RNA helicase
MFKQNYHYRSRRRKNFKFNNFNQRGFRIRTFDPSTIIGGLTSTTTDSEEYVFKNKFSDFPLDGKLSENIKGHGYNTPTPIQDQAIPEILSGKDVVGVANTGTGKTAAFLIPLINKVRQNNNSNVLIITPTRELAVQIDDELHLLASGLGIISAVCIGGVSIRGQINKLQRNPNFVIGTPGRLLDLENQRKVNFGKFDSIVLDEVDRMLDMGFISDIERIISNLPRNRQSLFFSATLDDKVKKVMGKFIYDPVIIWVKTTDTKANIQQDIIKLNGRNKSEVLCDILDKKEVSKTLIFMRTKRSADVLHRSLTSYGFQTAVLHGNKTQNQRQKSLDLFRQGKINVLIATDVASRGLDIDDITHVINYDLPESYEAYIHRIGRTARVDKRGVALTFVN